MKGQGVQLLPDIDSDEVKNTEATRNVDCITANNAILNVRDCMSFFWRHPSRFQKGMLDKMLLWWKNPRDKVENSPREYRILRRHGPHFLKAPW